MDNLMRSIEQKLLESNIGEVNAEYRAERCALLIRYGRFEEAKAEIQSLRQVFGGGEFARVSVWLLVLDGLMLYFEALSPAAWDRMRRAVALSEALRIRDLCGISSAWLAHINFNRSEYYLMAQAIKTAATCTLSSDDPWLARLVLVAADSSQYAGNWQFAKKCYELARNEAVKSGDRLTLGAVIYNRMAVGLSRLRVTGVGEHPGDAPFRYWVTEAASATNFHSGLSIDALPELSNLCAARASFLERDYAEAVRLFTRLLENYREGQLNLSKAAILAEIAVCECRLGNMDSARALLDEIMHREAHELDLDDELVFEANLDELRNSLGERHNNEDPPLTLRGIRVRYEYEMENLRVANESSINSINELILRLRI